MNKELREISIYEASGVQLEQAAAAAECLADLSSACCSVVCVIYSGKSACAADEYRNTGSEDTSCRKKTRRGYCSRRATRLACPPEVKLPSIDLISARFQFSQALLVIGDRSFRRSIDRSIQRSASRHTRKKKTKEKTAARWLEKSPPLIYRDGFNCCPRRPISADKIAGPLAKRTTTFKDRRL